MDDEWLNVIQELGDVVEATGRQLKRKPPFSKEDLVDLEEILKHGAQTIHVARVNTFQ